MRFEAIANRAAATFNEQTGMPDFEAEMRALQLADKYAGLDIEASLAAIEAPERIEIVCDEEENEDDIAVPPADGGDEGDNAG